MNKQTVIFDLDGTIADIEDRRILSTKSDGKINWSKFFDPDYISLDKPNLPVIECTQGLKKLGYTILILSGRSEATKEATIDWLNTNGVSFDEIRMRPTVHPFQYMPDNKLKQLWLDEMFPGSKKESILCVFDDRDKVVNMWRENGLICFQVAPGNF
jgi:hypothetical protein